MIVYTARHMLPVVAPPVSDAAVAVEDGRIVLSGRRKDVLKSAKVAEVRDLGDAVLIPGLVNAHTHLELSWMRGSSPEGADYLAWLRDLVARRREVEPSVERAAASEAIETMVSRGTVAVGEVANGTWTAGLLASSPLRGVVFHEVYGFPAADAESILEKAAVRLDEIESDPAVRSAGDRWTVALTPHAGHTTSAPLLRALRGRALASGEPLSIHVAESAIEAAFLRDGAGPFVDFLKEREAWDESWRPPGHSPVDFLDRLGILGPKTLVVHAVHLDHADLSKLQGRGATVVTCPRSNRRLDVGLAPVSKLLTSGIPVALGTDSLASAPDLDLFAELAALREDHPGLAPAAALRMATLNGAAALGQVAHLGGIEKGRLDALIVVPLDDPSWDPLEVVTWDPPEVWPLASAPWEARAA